MSSTSGESFYPNEYLDVYEFETTSVDKVARYTLDFYMTPRAFNLTLGDFTGEGIRVGPPTYRVQEQMTTPVALINLPPMHRDIIEIEGENTEITIGEALYAEHSAGNLQEEWSSVESKRAWSLSTRIETSIGYLGNTVELSLNNTYEEDFSNTEGTINSIQYRTTTGHA